jgi:methylaspartate ammonia-lyase
MTVRKLTDAQKAAVVTIYTSNIRPSSIQHLAAVLGVSTRTIGRVIEEAGVTASKKLHVGEAADVMRLLYKHKITIDQLESLLSHIPVDTIKLLTQKKASRKSPTGHNGKQTLLPLNLPTSLELH